MFGSSYGLPNASPAPVEPIPPVRYSLPPTVLVQIFSSACTYATSPVRAATSAIPAYMYMARTAWPTGSVCSTARTCAWLYSSPRPLVFAPGVGPRSSMRNFARAR